MTVKYDVIIVGAGASGLMAGHSLTQAGHSVLILEAREKIGGRIYTIKPPNFSTKIEAGAEFVHGDLPLTKKLIEQAKGQLTKVDGKYYRFETTISEQDFVDEDWEKFMTKLQTVEEDLTLHDFLQQNFTGHHDLYDRVKKYAEGYNAADIRLASCLALKEEWKESEAAQQYRPEGGYEFLIEYLVGEITRSSGEIRVQSPVKKIEWSNNFVKVYTHGQLEFISQKIIVTIPVSLLNTIEFTPSIKSLSSAASIGFGSIIKCIVELDQKLFDQMLTKAPEMFFMFSDESIPTWWTQNQKTPQLTGWLGGPDVHKLPKDEKDLRDLAITSLQNIFKLSASEIKLGVKAVFVYNWATDEFAKGAYSFNTLGTEEARSHLRIPVEDVVFFAGEALYAGANSGTVEAAFSTGMQAAANIIETLMREKTPHA